MFLLLSIAYALTIAKLLISKIKNIFIYSLISTGLIFLSLAAFFVVIGHPAEFMNPTSVFLIAIISTAVMYGYDYFKNKKKL
jgi:Zn-dependent membrane protease YugP